MFLCTFLVLFLSMVFVVFSLLFSSLVLFLVVVVVGLGSARVLDPGYFPVRISVHILGCSFCFHFLLQIFPSCLFGKTDMRLRLRFITFLSYYVTSVWGPHPCMGSWVRQGWRRGKPGPQAIGSWARQGLASLGKWASLGKSRQV